MSDKSIGISVVVPVYNSELSLRELVGRLEIIMEKIAKEYELILVNDGSKDKSWGVISQLALEKKWIRGINLMQNYGQHNALLCGIRAALYEVIVTMDDDLQNPPEEIPKLLEKMTEEYDVVYGTPQEGQHGLWRNMASRMTKMALQSAMGAKIARNASAFRAIRTNIRNAFNKYSGPFVSIDVLLTWGTERFTFVYVRNDPRHEGTSNYTFRKLVVHALNMMTGYSTLPLQVASLIGFAFMFFGMGIFTYVIGRYLILGYSVPGFPFLASIISIFSGVQLFALGMIGEYLARMYFRSMGRPDSVIRNTTEFQPYTAKEKV